MAGEHIGSHAPYGYMKNPDNKKEWLIDEEAAEVVREIFRLCVNGYGPTRIANILTERKILCPTYYALEHGKSHEPFFHLTSICGVQLWYLTS